MWTLVSLALCEQLRFLRQNYGSIGAINVLVTWRYASGLVVLVGGVINAQIEHANGAGKAPGEKNEQHRPTPIPRQSQKGSAVGMGQRLRTFSSRMALRLLERDLRR